MKSSSNLARPDLAFIVPWLIVLACYIPIVTPLTPEFEPHVALVLGFNLVTAPMIFYLVEWAVRRRLGPHAISQPVLDAETVHFLHKFLVIVATLWACVFVASIIYSGGLPLIWTMAGSSKTYSDFGIPTVGGLSILLRGFSASLCIFLFVATGRSFYFLLWGALLLLCISEISRSALFMLACQSLSIFLLLKSLKIRHILLAGVVLIALFGMFILLGSLRGIQMSASDFGVSSLGGLPPGFYWTWAYIVSPLGNVNYAAALGIAPTYIPSNTLGSVVPSIIGNTLGLRATEYPIKLIDESLNATSIYAPLIADFGYIGAALLVTLFQTIASYAYSMARRGRLLYILFYPALFGSLVLSIFYIYLMTLPILLVPAMVIWMRRYLARKRVTLKYVGEIQVDGA